MGMYIAINIIIMFIGIFTYRKNRKYINVIYLVMIILSIIAGLRGGFTEDYKNYAQYFLNLKYLSVEEILTKDYLAMERGFVLLSKIVRMFTEKVEIYFLFLSFLTNIAFCKMFVHNSPIWYLTILLYVSIGDYYTSFNLTRQILAVSVALLSIKYIYGKGKFVKYATIIFGASLIHRTALVMLPMYFLLKRKISKKNILFILCSGIVLFAVVPHIVYLAQIYLPYYQNYPYGLDAGSINAAIPMIGVLIFSYFAPKYLACDFDVNDSMNRVMINGCLWGCIFLVLGVRVYMLTRFAYYFKPFAWLVVPNIVYACKRRNERVITLEVIFVLSILFVWITLKDTGYNPFYFCWE